MLITDSTTAERLLADAPILDACTATPLQLGLQLEPSGRAVTCRLTSASIVVYLYVQSDYQFKREWIFKC